MFRAAINMEETISIHAPRVGSDSSSTKASAVSSEFQSTLPVWGATIPAASSMKTDKPFQSTLPVWGATVFAYIPATMFAFQSTLPVWGATMIQDNLGSENLHFNPRSPCGERLANLCKPFACN